MNINLASLPETLVPPADDGAAAHVEGQRLPSVVLPGTDGRSIDLGALAGRWVIFVYPMTGRPGVALPDGWDDIPGARGCTPQSCSFRDQHHEFLDLGVRVLGLSVQDTRYQREARDRLHLPFQLLSDASLILRATLGLPTFCVDGVELYKRLVLVADGGRVTKVFYPVFPPNRSAEQVLSWLHGAA